MEELMNVLAIRNLENAEQRNNRPHNQRNPRNPFEELNEKQFIKMFRLSKDLVLHLVESLEPYIQPAQRATDLDITTKVSKLKIQRNGNRAFLVTTEGFHSH